MKKLSPIVFNQPTISKKDLIKVMEHLIDSDLSNGESVQKFENELEKVISARKVILTNSASSSLYLILKHIGINSGDEIILSALSEPFVLEVINLFNAKPILIDISVDTLQMNPEQITEKITKETKAIIINHHFGYSFPLIKDNSNPKHPKLFLEDKEEHRSIKIIEDVTTGLFSKIHNHYLGTLGDYGFACFGKERLITMGKGGAIIVKDKKNAAKILEMRSPNESIKDKSKGEHFVGERLDVSISDLQAALGLSELSMVNKFMNRRKLIKQFYQDSIAKGKHAFLLEKEGEIQNNLFFPVILNSNLNLAKQFFAKEKIMIKDLLENTITNLLPYDKKLTKIYQLKHKTLFIPIYPLLQKEEIEKIALLINSLH